MKGKTLTAVQAMHESFDNSAFLRGTHKHTKTFSVGTSCSTVPMNVRIRCPGYLEVNDMVDSGNIETSSRNIGCKKYSVWRVFESIQIL